MRILPSIALFLALGGGAAIASHEVITSSDIVDDAVRSRHIADRHVGAGEIATEAVEASKLAPDSVGSAAVAPDGVAGPDLAAGAATGAKVPDGSLRPGRVLDESLTALDVNEASFDRTRFVDGEGGACDPESETFVQCAEATVNLTRNGTVLLIATATWETNAGGGKGGCELRNQVGTDLDGWNAGENANTTDAAGNHLNHAVVLEGTTVNAGSQTFSLHCQEVESDITYHDAHITVINPLGAGS